MIEQGNKKDNDTSWGGVASWYDSLLENDSDSYQSKLISPHLLRLVAPQKDERLLDLACGQGIFSREFAKSGAEVIGVDIAPELISIAKKNSPQSVHFFVSSAEKLPFIESASVHKLVIVLALQNIENVDVVFSECRRVLKKGGKIFLVLNHPAFRIPKESSWGFDAEKKVQYRRVDQYLSEAKVKIDMNPGKEPKKFTLSFHRPLQFYFKQLVKNNFSITRLEEWNSHKVSEKGPKKEAEDRARKEIPLFLFLEGKAE